MRVSSRSHQIGVTSSVIQVQPSIGAEQLAFVHEYCQSHVHVRFHQPDHTTEGVPILQRFNVGIVAIATPLAVQHAQLIGSHTGSTWSTTVQEAGGFSGVGRGLQNITRSLAILHHRFISTAPVLTSNVVSFTPHEICPAGRIRLLKVLLNVDGQTQLEFT
jgi:hypothetical protein